jgi:hypothetical protein
MSFIQRIDKGLEAAFPGRFGPQSESKVARFFSSSI